MLQLIQEHSALFIGGGVAVMELILRMLPGAWPLTKIIYEALNKVVANKESGK